MLRYFSFIGFVCVFILLVSCENPTQSNDNGYGTILSPADNQEYGPYQIIFTIFEYDTTKWFTDEGFTWECSKDTGNKWEKIIDASSPEHEQTQLMRSENNPFKYSVRQWKPVLNGIESDIDIWIKVSTYGRNKSVIRKNIKIRMSE